MYPLNSIDGIMKQLKKDDIKPLSDSGVHEFVQKYHAASLNISTVDALGLTVKNFREKHGSELKSFKEARDKVIAHSEFAALIDTVPAYDVMERLFAFGADFYAVITKAFLGSGPDDLSNNRPARADFIRLLEQIGIKDAKLGLE